MNFVYIVEFSTVETIFIIIEKCLNFLIKITIKRLRRLIIWDQINFMKKKMISGRA